MSKRIVFAMLVVTACTATEEPTEVAQTIGPNEGIETQGRYLLSEVLDPAGADPTYHVSVGPRAIERSGAIATVRFDGAASLAATDSAGRLHRGADPWFIDLRLPFAGGGAGELKLASARVDGALTLYRLLYRPTPTAPWSDPCDKTEAVAMYGRWTRTGVHEVHESVSFACLGNGVGGKCTRWGYPAGSNPDADLWKTHLACTRMARNDMCGDGTSYTHEGTAIQLYDYIGVSEPPPDHFEGVASWPPPAENFYYEAAWTVDGPTCATKLRWQRLQLSGPCPAKLHDPRLDPTVSFCLDEPPLDAGVFLLNKSRYNTLSLQTWTKNGEYVSTVRGYWGGGEIVQPFDDQTGYEHVGFDAMLLRSRPESVQASDVREVHLYMKDGDFVVSDTAPAGYSDRGVEGLVFTSQLGTNMVPFRLFRRQGGSELYSRAGVDDPPGYVRVRDLGWLPPL